MSDTTQTTGQTTGLQLRSLITAAGTLELSLRTVTAPAPAADEVVIKVQAAPINPSDLGLLFGAADMATFEAKDEATGLRGTAQVPEKRLRSMAARIGHALPVGNEGAGLVVAAGLSDAAQALLGKTVAAMGGGMYAQYRTVPVANCLALPDGTRADEGASCFVNPLTALGMVETMRNEGHTGLVHTAAASNLGQMLNRICLADGVPLVNIVRSQEQVALLRGMGAAHVCDSSAPGFLDDLTDALAATGATLAFDAIGGGPLAGQILTCMEAAVNRKETRFSVYGSSVNKQVYIYGGLSLEPTVVNRNFGMCWGMGGWLLTPFLIKSGPEVGRRLRDRVARELKTTFASHYAREISLAEMLRPETIALYGRRSTGEKFLLNPDKDLGR